MCEWVGNEGLVYCSFKAYTWITTNEVTLRTEATN